MKSFLLKSLFFSQKKNLLVGPKVYCKEKPAQWMLTQIQEDLAPFSQLGVLKAQLDKVMSNKDVVQKLGLVRYRIVQNHVHVQIPFFSRPLFYITQGLRRLAKTYFLPDVDFIITLEDAIDHVTLEGPIFASAKKIKSHVILFPDFEALKGCKKNLQAVEVGNKTYPWEKKLDQCIWRGSMTGGTFTRENFTQFPRSIAVSKSLKSPESINARYTKISQCENPQTIQKNFSKFFGDYLPIEKQIQYKMQLLLDGNAAAFSSTYWQLFSNSVILKQDSDSIQWYFRALRPYEHYISIVSDLRNLEEQIQWTLQNDSEAKKIACQGQLFAQENLTYPRILQYFYYLLLEYSKILH